LDTGPEIGITPILTVLLAFWRSEALHYYNCLYVMMTISLVSMPTSK
jgi:hypothetical protein